MALIKQLACRPTPLSDLRARGEELEDEYAAEVSAAARDEDVAAAEEADDLRLGPAQPLRVSLEDDDVVLVVVGGMALLARHRFLTHLTL